MKINIDITQQEIVETFELFDDWMDRYQYLIDIGKQLPQLDPGEMTDDNLVSGCQSQVWLVASGSSEKLTFRANSDAAIVSGLIALLLQIYSGHSAAEILDSKPWFVEKIGLADHLSLTRANGLASMLAKIRGYAQMVDNNS
ncbi:MAG: SufE family protein [Proteobacteria bacterium]|nr:SufE family protein [Pseudomonadota bacterium]